MKPTTPARGAPTRRAFLATTALGGAVAAIPNGARAQANPKYGESSYQYEMTLTEGEWRNRLTEDQFEILREGGTEFPTSSDLWDDKREGEFFCAGCDLALYSSTWRADIDLGWVFFHHSHTDAVLTGLDRGNPYTGQRPEMGEGDNPRRTLLEVHCRRCGGHLGHIVHVKKQTVHCINGLALRFEPTSA